MALPTFQAFYQSVKAGFASFGTTVTGFTFIGGGTSVAIMYNVGAGPVQSSTFYQNVNYVGVPGPELAAGLPILAAAIAYGSYRAIRNARAANNAA